MDNLVLTLFYFNGFILLLFWCYIAVFSKSWRDRIAFVLVTVAVALLGVVFFPNINVKMFDKPPQETYPKSSFQGVKKWT